VNANQNEDGVQPISVVRHVTSPRTSVARYFGAIWRIKINYTTKPDAITLTEETNYIWAYIIEK